MRWAVLLLLAGRLAAGDVHLVAVGVEQYDDPAIAPLQYAVADVQAVADALRQSGVPAANVTVLTSDATDYASRPTRSNVLGALQRVRERAESEDTLVAFFSGHGMQKGDQTYLLTSDSRRDLLEDTALPMRLVNVVLQGSRLRRALFVVDACRNDPDSGKATADAALGEPLAKGLRPRLTAGAGAPAADVALLLACDVGQRAWEMPAEGHGAFTHYLLQGLQAKAQAADGSVSLSRLAAWVQQEVPAWCARAKRPRQTPRLDNPAQVDFLLVPPRPTTPQPAAPAAPPPTGETLGASYLLAPPVIDGRIADAEWTPAAWQELTLGNAAGTRQRTYRCRFGLDTTALYVAVVAPVKSGPDAYVALYLDGDADGRFAGQATSPATDLLVGLPGPGAAATYDYYHWGSSGQRLASTGAAKAGGVGLSGLEYEFRIPLADLGTRAGRTVGFQIRGGEDGTAANTDAYPVLPAEAWPDATRWARLLLVPGAAPAPQPGDPPAGWLGTFISRSEKSSLGTKTEFVVTVMVDRLAGGRIEGRLKATNYKKSLGIARVSEESSWTLSGAYDPQTGEVRGTARLVDATLRVDRTEEPVTAWLKADTLTLELWGKRYEGARQAAP